MGYYCHIFRNTLSCDLNIIRTNRRAMLYKIGTYFPCSHCMIFTKRQNRKRCKKLR